MYLTSNLISILDELLVERLGSKALGYCARVYIGLNPITDTTLLNNGMNKTYYKNFDKCPVCHAHKTNYQPDRGSHSFTTDYTCGLSTITLMNEEDKNTIIDIDCQLMNLYLNR